MLWPSQAEESSYRVYHCPYLTTHRTEILSPQWLDPVRMDLVLALQFLM
jgi:hypothetical protein